MGSIEYETIKIQTDSFYDTVLVSINMVVPTKKYRHKFDDKGNMQILPPTKSVNEFDEYMKKIGLKHSKFDWPLKGELFLYLDIKFSEKHFKKKDVDNLAKPIMDSMKGIVYDDDVQISTLLVFKQVSTIPSFVIGLKCLDGIDESFFSVPNPIVGTIKDQ